MDHATLFVFGSACACLGFSARWVAVTIEEHITAVRAKQASCEHTWGATLYHAAYPTRHCKWCKKQQHYYGDAETGEWRDY